MVTKAPRKLEVRRNVIKISHFASEEEIGSQRTFATHEVYGILPGCRKVVLLSISPNANQITVRPLFGYNGRADVSPNVWADVVQHAEIISDPLFPLELTPELKTWAREQAMSICSCPAVTDLSEVHPDYLAQQIHDRVSIPGIPGMR